MRRRLPAKVFERLEQLGALARQFGGKAFVVGGLVRDLLLGHTNLDVDIVVEGDAVTFAKLVGHAVGAAVTTHPRFKTATLIYPDGFKLDLATGRREHYRSPAALPTVEPSSIENDLFRRDFTINALAIRLNHGAFGELLDLYGGRWDLERKTIRVLHSRSFIDDPTRAFRAIRFEQRLGFRIDEQTLRLIDDAAHSHLFHRLSSHRLLDELILLLSEKKPRETIARMAELDLLRFIHPQLAWTPRLQMLLKRVDAALNWYTSLALVTPYATRAEGWVVYLMALLENLSETAVEECLKRLGVPQRQLAKIRFARLSLPDRLRRLAKRPAPRPAETYHILESLPEEALVYLVAKSHSRSVRSQVADFLRRYTRIRPILNGTDLRAMGFKPGPLYKKILNGLLDAHLNGEVKTVADERALVKRLAGL